MITYDPITGELVASIQRAIEIAKIAQEPVEFTFNGISMQVQGSHERQVYLEYERTKRETHAKRLGQSED